MTKYLEMKGEKDMSNLCQWSFEGYFANYIFHNEKTGEGIFKICTSHSFLMGDSIILLMKGCENNDKNR